MLVLAASLLPAPAHAQPPERGPGEAARPFVERVLGRTEAKDDLHVLESSWNGQPVLLADFLQGEERNVVALLRGRDGRYRRLHVTTGEEEGGYPDLAAIGFANADRDPAAEMIVILTWPVQHYDVAGTSYSVRILDDPKRGEAGLRPLDTFSRRFEADACDCEWRDGSRKRYRFRTIAAVRQALRRAGF